MVGNPYVYRRIWEAAHALPWPCCFCGELVTKWGRASLEGGIHHLDGNHDNHALENLAPAHVRCHLREHRLGTTHTPATKAKISAAGTGRQWLCPGCGRQIALTWRSRHRCGRRTRRTL